MTARTVIGFSRAGDRINISLDRAPVVFDYDSGEVDLGSVSGNTLAELGEALIQLLRTREPVKTGLEAALQLPPGSSPAPLYFHVRAAAADAVPWEQLFAPPNGFCALDARWPVGRIAERVANVRGRGFEPPLRVVAVLSAAGRDPGPQLATLRTAVAAAEMPVRLHVISGDEDLLKTVTGPGVTTELIGASSPELCRQLAKARPHVVHLLCHGMSVAGVRTLAFATIPDVDAGREDFGSLSVSVAELVTALEACDPWLVVLAACQTAQAGEAGEGSGRAFAHDLVSAGATAVIGMRRLVDLTDTDRFCDALYPGVMDTIRAAVQPEAPGEQIIEWASVLTGPRRVMGGADPSVQDSWLDPVLYVQSDDLRVFPQTAQMSADDYSKLQGKLDKYRGWLASQDPATADPAAIAEVRGHIADIEAILSQAGA